MRMVWLAAGLLAATFASTAIAQRRPVEEAQVRMRNDTGRVMEQVRIDYPFEAQADRLEPGQATAYQPKRGMLGAISLQVLIDGQSYRLRPVDGMGPLARGGRFSYSVTFVPQTAPGEPRQLTAQLVPDR